MKKNLYEVLAEAQAFLPEIRRAVESGLKETTTQGKQGALMLVAKLLGMSIQP